MSASEQRLARNQTLFREVNERIEQMASDGNVLEFVCECSDTSCIATVPLKPAEYERIRSESTWFFVKPGHEMPEIERVVSQDDGYVIVEKLIERDYAEEADPRSGGTD